MDPIGNTKKIFHNMSYANHDNPGEGPAGRPERFQIGCRLGFLMMQRA
jgi:hypothetical protein